MVGNISKGLPMNCFKCSCVNFPVGRNGERLLCPVGNYSPQLHMTAAPRDYLKAK